MRKKDSLTPQNRSYKFFFGYVIVFTAICLAIVLFGEGEDPDNEANLYWGLACMVFVLTISACLYSFFNKQIVDIRWEEEGLVFVSNSGKEHRVACENVQEINSTAARYVFILRGAKNCQLISICQWFPAKKMTCWAIKLTN